MKPSASNDTTKTVLISDLMRTSGAAFGTSGVRGLVTALTPEVCYAYTRAFLQALPQQNLHCVSMATDLRPSSPRIAQACIAAMVDAGLQVDYLGALPTPALALHAQTQGQPGLMITGSHIPFDRNGIKFYKADGEISKQDEALISQQTVSVPTAIPLHALPTVNHQPQQSYLQRYLDFFPQHMLRGWRLGLFEHSSVARDLLKTLLEEFGAEVISLGRSDTFVPIDTEALTPENIEMAKNWVSQHQLHAILSTDGDGDRPLMTDEQGRWIRGDVLGLLSAAYLKAQAVATTITASKALEQSALFQRIARTKVGSPYVIDALNALSKAQYQPVVGYESNGGFLLATHANLHHRSIAPLPTRDAVLPMLCVLAQANAANNKRSIASLLETLPKRFTASGCIKAVARATSDQLLSDVRNHHSVIYTKLVNQFGPILETDLTDGVRMTFAQDHIIHLRPSGNAPELRCYVETADETNTALLLDEIIKLLSAHLNLNDRSP